MVKKEKMPEELLEYFKSSNINPDYIRAAYKSNLPLKQSVSGETWLCIDKRYLHIISVSCNDTDIENSTEMKRRIISLSLKIIKLFKKERADQKKIKRTIDSQQKYPLKEIEEIKTIEQVNISLIVARIGLKDFLLARYTNALNHKFEQIAEILNKIVKGEELSSDDFKENIRVNKCPKCGRPYPDDSRRLCLNCLNKKSIFLRILSYTRSYKKEIFIILMLSIISTFLNMVPPYIGGRFFFDNILTEDQLYYGKIGLAVFLMLSSQLASLLLRIGVGRINSYFSASIIYDIKTEIFSSMQQLSMSFFSNKQTGKLMSRINYDSMQLQYFFHDGVQEFLINVLMVAGISIILFWMNWQLALFILIPIPLTIYIMRGIFPVLKKYFSRRFRRRASLNSMLNNTLTGFRVVKAFGKEDDEKVRFQHKNQALYEVSLKTGQFTSTVFPFMGFIMGIGSFFVWSVGGWQVLKGSLTFGTLISFAAYTGMFYGPIKFLSRVVDWWSYTMNSAQRIFEIIDAVPEVNEALEPVSIPDIKGEVVLKDVTFAYEKSKPVLKNINLKVAAGEVIGFVGHSGAGKSTLTNLIARLYDVDEGSILIDGIDIRDIKIDDLRTQIGIVLQDTFLFNSTIAENILYARPEASLQEAIYAAKIANAHEFIIKLPDGYDTLLGSKGHNLSGGEKQRISIARAVLKNPKILILDEATASVDTRTEKLIQEALERLIKGRTTFVIAHRLSTLRNADRLFILEKGKNVESGTHQELLKKKGVYYKLLQIQKEALKIQGI